MAFREKAKPVISQFVRNHVEGEMRVSMDSRIKDQTPSTAKSNVIVPPGVTHRYDVGVSASGDERSSFVIQRGENTIITTKARLDSAAARGNQLSAGSNRMRSDVIDRRIIEYMKKERGPHTVKQIAAACRCGERTAYHHLTNSRQIHRRKQKSAYHADVYWHVEHGETV